MYIHIFDKSFTHFLAFPLQDLCFKWSNCQLLFNSNKHKTSCQYLFIYSFFSVH